MAICRRQIVPDARLEADVFSPMIHRVPPMQPFLDLSPCSMQLLEVVTAPTPLELMWSAAQRSGGSARRNSIGLLTDNRVRRPVRCVRLYACPSCWWCALNSRALGQRRVSTQGRGWRSWELAGIYKGNPNIKPTRQGDDRASVLRSQIKRQEKIEVHTREGR